VRPIDFYRRSPLWLKRALAHPAYHLAQRTASFAMPLARRLAWSHFGLDEVRDRSATDDGAGMIWVEVGANRGGSLARAPQGARIFAFEPNLQLIADLQRARPDATVIGAAAAEANGVQPFHLASFDAASSFLAVDERSIAALPPEEQFRHEAEVLVPTVRLDAFMAAAGLDRIDVLVSDAQGYDLEVLRSLGTRIADVQRIEVEASVEGRDQYVGAANSRSAVVEHLTGHGFVLVEEHVIARGAAVDLVFVRA